MEWNPNMDEAPKDGRPVLLRGETNLLPTSETTSHIAVGFWYGADDTTTGKPGWTTGAFTSSFEEMIIIDPTAWMPTSALGG